MMTDDGKLFAWLLIAGLAGYLFGSMLGTAIRIYLEKRR